MKAMKRIFIGVVCLAVLLGGAFLIFRDNIHTIIPGKFYRSAQLGPAGFTRLATQDHLKSIINLRGSNPQDAWYREEIAVSKKLGIHHYNVRMSAYLMPKRATFLKLVKTLQTAPTPVLMHCKGGSDRTGLAAAIVVLLHNGSYVKARDEVSWEYFSYSPRSVGRQILPIYARWLKQHHYRSTKKHFLAWVAQTSV